MALLAITSNLTPPKRAEQQRLSWETICSSIIRPPEMHLAAQGLVEMLVSSRSWNIQPAVTRQQGVTRVLHPDLKICQ